MPQQRPINSYAPYLEIAHPTGTDIPDANRQLMYPHVTDNLWYVMNAAGVASLVNTSGGGGANGFTTTATAAGTTTLTVASTPIQEFTGTTTQDCVLPDATTLIVGWTYVIRNASTGAVTVKTNGGATLLTLAANQEVSLYCKTIGTAAGTWSQEVVTGNGARVLAQDATLVTPTIASFANAAHNHTNAAGGGQLTDAALSAAVGLAKGGTAADLSATGAATHFLRQASAGAAVTVGAIVSADLATALTTPGAIGGTTPAAGAFTTLTTTGNVGIGTPSPYTPLDVNGTIKFGSFYFGNSTSNTNVNLGYQRAQLWGSATDITLSTYNAGSISFKTQGVTSGEDAIKITSAGRVGIGAATPATKAHVRSNTSATNAVVNVLTLEQDSTGTPAAGLGTGLLLAAESSTTEGVSIARLRSLYTTVTHASYATRSVLSGFDSTGERDVIGFGANGSAALLGFYPTVAAAPVAQPTALTTQLTAITHTAPGTPDYAVQDLTAGGFGFVTKDEGNTVLSVIANLQVRVGELETKLEALGLIA